MKSGDKENIMDNIVSDSASECNDDYNKRLELLNQEAYALFSSAIVQKYIAKLSQQVAGFARYMDESDYMQEAYFGVHRAMQKYIKSRALLKLGEITTDDLLSQTIDEDLREYLLQGREMAIETFAYWYLQKFIFRAANRASEVIYHIYKDGVFCETIINADFQQRKQRLLTDGYTYTSTNMMVDMKMIIDGDEVEIEFVDETMRGFRDEYVADVFKLIRRRRQVD